MKVNFAHLCDYALLSVDGKLSALGIFTRISTAQIPAFHPRAFLVFEIEMHYSELGKPFDVRVDCVDSDGNPILQARTTIQTQGKAKPGDRPLVPQILQMPPIQFNRAGAHEINVFLGSDTSPKASVQFEVFVTETPPAPPIQGKPPLGPPPEAPT